MPRPLQLDRVFSSWLKQRRTEASKPGFSIAIESPCAVCQPRIGDALAEYLNEFDDHSGGNEWLTLNDHRFEQIQAHPEFRYLIGQEKADDTNASLQYLGTQGFLILEMAACHAETGKCQNVFQVSMSCQEPEEKRHHLWLNAKRLQTGTLIPMIANSYLDWVTQGGDAR